MSLRDIPAALYFAAKRKYQQERDAKIVWDAFLSKLEKTDMNYCTSVEVTLACFQLCNVIKFHLVFFPSHSSVVF
jgi:hypothetical protein